MKRRGELPTALKSMSDFLGSPVNFDDDDLEDEKRSFQSLYMEAEGLFLSGDYPVL